ncbi:MAG: hypothetical protein J5478_00885 [Bacteroidales bacterium]|nr:hypothetical protein [Bacteroidales bacterium]
MKTFLRFSVLAALLPLLFACDIIPDNDDPVLPEPAYVSFAGNLSIGTPGTKAATDPAPVGSIVSIELTESGLYFLGKVADEKGTVNYSNGKFSASGNEYKLNGYGSIFFDNSRSGAVSLVLQPNGGAAEQVQATFQKPTSTNKVYRAWKVDKTRLTVKGWTTVGADFTGCNFREIADFLRANSHKVPSEVPDRNISSLSLTGTEKMIFAYSDGWADMSEFSLHGNVMHYSWEQRPKGFTFESDEAVIEYMDGKCLLTISGRIQNSSTSGSVTFVLSPLE